MDSIFRWNGQLNLTTPNALRLCHVEARNVLFRAALGESAIAEAAKGVAELCLPHFEYEEQAVFPVLALLPYLTPENLRPDMADVMPLISEFSAMRDALVGRRQSILAAIDALREAAYREQNGEIAEFACNLKTHEMIKADVIYPTVMLIGDYLQRAVQGRCARLGTVTRRTMAPAALTIGKRLPEFKTDTGAAA